MRSIDVQTESESELVFVRRVLTSKSGKMTQTHISYYHIYSVHTYVECFEYIDLDSGYSYMNTHINICIYLCVCKCE